MLEIVENCDFLANAIHGEYKSYIFEYYVNGVFSVVALWLQNASARSVDEMTSLIYRLTHLRA